MRKRTYFLTRHDDGWPEPEWLERYFLTAAGRAEAFSKDDNDSWGLSAHGLDGTEHLKPFKDRVDLGLTIQGHPTLGILLWYHVSGGGRFTSLFSKGDMTRIREWVRNAHSDLMPVGLFIPFEPAFAAVKEFIKRDGALP